jgi:hypothetical protein
MATRSTTNRHAMPRSGPRAATDVDDPELLAELAAAVRAKEDAQVEARRILVEAEDAIVEVIDRCLVAGIRWKPIANVTGGQPNNVAARYRALVEQMRAARQSRRRPRS